jgi:electron transfer flavoprotein beta subunit
MKILAAIKQVPARDSALKPNAAGSWIVEDGLSFEINEPDAYALEEALQLAEKHGGEVVALCAGPERVSSSIREALAKGASRAIHLLLPDPSAYDSFALASALAPVIAAENPDLVLTGLQSDDYGYGQTGVVLAELLAMAHASIVMQVEIQDRLVRVKRELEDGWFQYVTLPLPSVLTIQSGINKLRYATLMGIKKARAKEVKLVEAPPPAPATAVIERIYAPERAKQSVMIGGSPAEQAARLVEILKHEVRVL